MAGDTTKDMTQGSPMKLILGFSIPLLFGFLFQQFYNVMDTIIVGRVLGVNALAGVGSTGSLNFLIIGFCMGVCNGFAIPLAHKFGAKDYSGMRRFIANGMWLSILFSAVMTIATAVFCREMLMAMKTPDDIFSYAYSYIFIIFLGIPATYLYNMLSGIIRAMGDSKTPLVFLTLSSFLNIALDLVCIISLHMGVAGDGCFTGRFRRILSDLYDKKISSFTDGKRGMEDKYTIHEDAVRDGHSDGIAVFHYGDRQRDPAGGSQYTGRGRSSFRDGSRKSGDVFLLPVRCPGIYDGDLWRAECGGKKAGTARTGDKSEHDHCFRLFGFRAAHCIFIRCGIVFPVCGWGRCAAFG